MSETKNIEELRKINERIYAIAQEYGSNSRERYNLLTAFEWIFDAIERIGE